LNSVIDYLKTNWTAKEILNLQNKIQQAINQVSIYPEQFQKFSKNQSLYKVIVGKNNYLVYQINKETNSIEIINFRGTKQNPVH
jgi:hypothetical protein